jgi:inosose dehydratase
MTPRIRVGCQTYTWEMLGPRWTGTVEDIVTAISEAGYEGVEITNTMLGPGEDAPERLRACLEPRGLAFSSFGFVPARSFTEAACMKEEIRRAEEGIRLASRFPGCRLDLAGGSSPDKADLREKFRTMCTIYNEVAALAGARGVPVDVHPHSHHGSIIETAEEYQMLMEMTDPQLVGWCPDTGHIVRGGQDLLGTLTRYAPRIRNVHLKDADQAGRWRPLGQGACDIPAVMRLLTGIGYTGWVIAEEESDEAAADPKGGISGNRAYLRSLGF